MTKISASLLNADLARLGEEVARAERAGVDRFHIDVMDCHYVPNLALTPHYLSALLPHTSLPFDVHLEVSHPYEVLGMFGTLGADTIIVQADTCDQPSRIFQEILAQKSRVGVAINRTASVTSSLELLSDLDLLVIMAVDPGFGGQTLDPHTPPKVREARSLIDGLGLKTKIAVDGGVNPDNAMSLVAAGADLLIVGSALFRASNMESVVSQLKRLGQCEGPQPHCWWP